MERDIDLIIPMVFPNDASWLEAYATSHGATRSALSSARFRSWDTEETLVRLCLRFMPWLRRIYILLAGETQVQPWMAAVTQQHPGRPEVRLVFHREFIPHENLPCFNVNTIEMFLHRIPGLSERFIYSNDDFFPIAPLRPDDFFRGGLPCQHHDEKPFPSRPNIFEKFVKSGLDMVAADFGQRFPRTWLKGGHSMQPMLRSTVEEVWRLHGDRISASFTIARSERNFNQYIFPFFQHLSGRYVDHVPSRRYVGPKVPTKELPAIIRDPALAIVCLNDNDHLDDWERRAAVVRRELSDRLDAAGPSDNNDNQNDNLMKPIDVLIVHYNSQELTEAAVRSLWKNTPSARVTIFDNSDRRPFDAKALPRPVTVIDNTRGQVVDWQSWLAQYPDKRNTTANDWASAKHCYSVDVCLDRFPDGFVLMDSDVLVRQDITPIVDRSKAFTGEIGAATKKFPVPRVLPMLCWLNTPLMKTMGVRFFNARKMWKLTEKSPDCYYDTGAWLLEAVKAARLPFGTFTLDDYALHYGHGSWGSRKKVSAPAWLEQNKALWDGDIPAGEETPAAEPAGVAAGGDPSKVRIFVCTHGGFTPVVKSPVYEVVDSRELLPADGRCADGLRQPFYSELFHFRHIADRQDLPEYVGVCHYRRYFSFMDDVPDMDALFQDCDAVTTVPINLRRSVRDQYRRCHNVKDLDIVSGIIRRDYPDLWPVYERSLQGPMLYACNMLILRRDDFRWLVDTVYDIFGKYLEAIGYEPGVSDGGDFIERRILANAQDYHLGRPNTGTVQYQYRIAAFLSERIINALLPYRFKRIRHYDKVLTNGCLPQQVALCAIGRLENRYAREWVEYHLGLGFNRIVVYDNNRDGEERFEEVLQDYVDDGRVEIVDFRNRELAQIPAYNDCYRRYGALYGWIAFLDFDEFLVTGKPLHEFLAEYTDTDCVFVNWRVMTDSGHVRYEDRPLRERFTVPLADDVLMRGKYRYNDHVKSIVRGGLAVGDIFGGQMPHVPAARLRCCTPDHRAVACSPFQRCDHSRARIDHFTTKTIDEWLYVKYRRGFPIKITDRWRDEWAIPQFFEINERTEEKEAVLREWQQKVCP